MVSVSNDGKSNAEQMRLQITMELLVLQKVDTSTPTASIGPPTESKACIIVILNALLYLFYIRIRSNFERATIDKLLFSDTNMLQSINKNKKTNVLLTRARITLCWRNLTKY